MTSKKVIWMGYIGRTGEMRIIYKISKYLKGKNYFEDLGVDERIIINRIRLWELDSGLEYGPMDNFHFSIR
jgi:hypothetical protein